ncbi:hypothetical protein [Methanoregula sp.]|uniref:hypothetical protein n=1 Tax=Methanoregula sp. TaxID=2052170 RepID=UPI003569A276
MTNGESDYSEAREKERDRLIFELIVNRNGAEFQRSTNLDNKASNLIGFVGIIIGLLGTTISFIFDKIYKDPKIFLYYTNFRAILLIGIIFLTVSIICSLIAFFIKQYEIVPETDHLIKNYAKKDENYLTVLRIVAQEMSNTIVKNKDIDDDKAKWIKYSQIAFGAGMGLIIVFICGLLTI